MWPITGTQHAGPIDPRLCRARLPAAGTIRPPAACPDSLTENQEDRAVLCAVCSAEITRQQQATAVNGRHEHTFFNPAGIAFEIRCFHAAPGTVPQGLASAEFTWFPGYCWRVVLCAACQSHLGWLFTSGDSFYGLIAGRLR